MTKATLKKRYFAWICQLIKSEQDIHKVSSFNKLLKHLDDTVFYFSIDMDMNRAEDGRDLRYRFAYEKAVDYHLIDLYFDDQPCSVLEMIAALSLRFEEDVMDDPELGNRTSKWFWEMIDNLGLGQADDSHYDQDHVDHVLNNFLNRNYAPDGKGGLFTINDSNCDLRTVDIWCQMCWYMDEIISKNGG